MTINSFQAIFGMIILIFLESMNKPAFIIKWRLYLGGHPSFPFWTSTKGRSIPTQTDLGVKLVELRWGVTQNRKEREGVNWQKSFTCIQNPNSC